MAVSPPLSEIRIILDRFGQFTIETINEGTFGVGDGMKDCVDLKTANGKADQANGHGRGEWEGAVIAIFCAEVWLGGAYHTPEYAWGSTRGGGRSSMVEGWPCGILTGEARTVYLTMVET